MIKSTHSLDHLCQADVFVFKVIIFLAHAAFPNIYLCFRAFTSMVSNCIYIYF